MKKLLSVLLAVVMLLSSVTSVSLTAFASETQISVGETITVYYEYSDEYYFTFTPDESGTYYFYSTSNMDCDPVCKMYNESEDEWETFDDYKEGSLDFAVGAYFEEGCTYTFEVYEFDYYKSEFDVTLSAEAPEGYYDDNQDDEIDYTLEFISVEPITFYEGFYSYIDDETGEEVYYLGESNNFYAEGNRIVITTEDGDVLNFVCVVDEDDSAEFVCDNPEYPNITSIGGSFSGNFKAGDTASADVWIKYNYLSDEYKYVNIDVNIVENPVSYIEYTANHTLKEGYDNYIWGVYDDDDNLIGYEDYYLFRQYVGDVLTVHYADGRVIDYVCSSYIDEYDGDEYIRFISSDGEGLEYNFCIGNDADIYENLYSVGENTITAHYAGKDTEFTFIIEPTDIERIEVNPISSTNLKKELDTVEYTFEDGPICVVETYWYCPDFEITYYLQDGTSETYKVEKYISDEGELEFDYYDIPYALDFDTVLRGNDWESGEKHSFDVFCTANIRASIEVTIDGDDKPAPTRINSIEGVPNGFTVSWDKVDETLGYQVQYATRSDFANSATVYGGATNTLSKTITGRASDTTYYVRVRTYKNINGEYVWGDWSEAKAVKTLSSKPAPTSITSVTPEIGGFTVNWSKVDETLGYQIQYATRSDFSNSALAYGGATNTLGRTITGRASNATYYVRVRTYVSVNGEYVWGDWSEAKAVKTLSSKPSPTSITSVTPVAGGFAVNWSKVDETTGYQIQFATRSDFSNGALVYGGATNTLGRTITGRANGVKYYVRVRTYKNISGEYIWGDWTPAVAVTTPAKPAPTSVTSVSGVKNGFTVNWSKVDETTGYQIQYATRSDFSNGALVYGGATNTLGRTITGRASNATYYVRVRTYKNINGEYVWGDWSPAVAVNTK